MNQNSNSSKGQAGRKISQRELRIKYLFFIGITPGFYP